MTSLAIAVKDSYYTVRLFALARLLTSESAPSKKDRYKPMQPKFASIKVHPLSPHIIDTNAIQRQTSETPQPLPQHQPQSPISSAAKDSGFEGAPKERHGRGAHKAGLDSEFETLEKNLKREPPPAVDWWDAALLPSKIYNDLFLGFSHLNILTQVYDDDYNIPLQEQKQMRKQRRQADREDKRDRIRMGLIPLLPNILDLNLTHFSRHTVRLSNLMKALTSDAVQDPTHIEARVRKEVAMRKHSRKYERGTKKNNKSEEEENGIVGAVFKGKTLTDSSHRIKVRKNAEQLHSTCVCICNLAFSMVHIEGAGRRIAWTAAAHPRGGEDVVIDHEGEEDDAQSDSGAGGSGGRAGKQPANCGKNRTVATLLPTLLQHPYVTLQQSNMIVHRATGFSKRSRLIVRKSQEVETEDRN
ncbi:pre-mRNA processing factor 3-domain-containing protein [Suillus paluster]|uniref:pre-mRNA processing factor 3-domain-containing protein n=1 Tax=Suillus paluster TaxID=48578 RepID=UPI001B85F623|nr:pre-mRNA processing factor 3-domain-containing protein [Suillus paluster]KAG1735644.1 pre-mRNA processing factor 3-domain-containing protein [Suillus paluster]